MSDIAKLAEDYAKALRLVEQARIRAKQPIANVYIRVDHVREPEDDNNMKLWALTALRNEFTTIIQDEIKQMIAPMLDMAVAKAMQRVEERLATLHAILSSQALGDKRVVEMPSKKIRK